MLQQLGNLQPDGSHNAMSSDIHLNESRPIRRAQNRPYARRRDVGIEAEAEQALSVGGAAFDVSCGLNIAALADRVLAVIDDVHDRTAGLRQRGDDAAHQAVAAAADAALLAIDAEDRSEEHTSELQSLMRISYAVFCLNKKTKLNPNIITHKNTTEYKH